MKIKLNTVTLVLYFMLFAGQVGAEGKIQAYFLNDSLNGLKMSDAYETHNMGLIYSNDEHYFKLDLGIVSPDMYVYRNKYREANRSFGELISLEIGEHKNADNRYRLYTRIKASGKFGIDELQDFAHRLLSLQQVNGVNDLIRMPSDLWIGVGLRREIEPNMEALQNIKINLDGFLGSDTSFLNARITKEFLYPIFNYDISFAGRLIAFDNVVSAPPINGKERIFIPEVAFGITYKHGPYGVFLRDTFSLPTIKSDNALYGVLSAGFSYNF